MLEPTQARPNTKETEKDFNQMTDVLDDIFIANGGFIQAVQSKRYEQQKYAEHVQGIENQNKQLQTELENQRTLIAQKDAAAADLQNRYNQSTQSVYRLLIFGNSNKEEFLNFSQAQGFNPQYAEQIYNDGAAAVERPQGNNAVGGL